MKRRGRAGFTLVEVVVAVVLAGVSALLAHELFGAVADHGRGLHAARAGLDRRSNAHRFLRSAFLSLEAGIDGAEPFSGRSDQVTFSTWLPTADGWLERVTLDLRLEEDRWVAAAASDPALVLARGVTALRFDYLLEPGGDSKWVSEWESAVSAPLAVRVRIARGERSDTVLYLIKARG